MHSSRVLRRLALSSAAALGSLIPIAGSAGATLDGPREIDPSLRTPATASYSELTNVVRVVLPDHESGATNLYRDPRFGGWRIVVSTTVPLVAGTGCTNESAYRAVCWSSRKPVIDFVLT